MMAIPNYHKQYTIPVILLIVTCVILFANTLGNSFMWDDERLIVNNNYIKSLGTIPFLFRPQYWNHLHHGAKGQYRPIRTASFVFDYLFWKTNPFGYHLTNILLHALNIILIYVLLFELIGRAGPPPVIARLTKSAEAISKKVASSPHPEPPWLLAMTIPYTASIPFLTALFFACHPIHTESVTWVKNRSDLLASVFFLLSFFFFIHYLHNKEKKSRVIVLSLGIFSFFLALCSKETAVTLPFILVLYTLCLLPQKERKRSIISTLPFFGVMAVYLIFKLAALGMLVSSQNPPIQMSFYSNFLTVGKTLAYYLALLLFPFRLNAERFFSIPGSFLEADVFLSFVTMLLLLVCVNIWFRRARLFAFALLWIFITLLPASNIIFLSGRPIAEQRLYIPSFGFCLFLGLVMSRFSFLSAPRSEDRRLRYIGVASVALIVAAYSYTTVTRNADWKNPFIFWMKTVERSPKSDRARNNLGNAYYYLGRQTDAIASYKKGIAINPGSAEIYYNLGTAYRDVGAHQKAIASFKKARVIDPRYTKADNNLKYARAYNDIGITLRKSGRYKEAIASFKKAIDINPQYAEAYYGLAIVYYYEKKYGPAVSYRDRAKELGFDSIAVFLEHLETRHGQ